ncbi:MAG: glycosyltransferase, partial [bacterium]|nr:glycosyltransferase [bacterium]
KIGLEKLIAAKKPDEEILVADGASTDGTPEYLAELKREGKIDFYISEPDYAESHALNKLFLFAKGTLIKIINDDDAYHYPAIEASKNFMLEHPEIDILGMNGGSYKHDTPHTQVLRPVEGYEENFLKWKKDRTPFEFAVLGLMFRRSSLPLLGFWDLSFKNADAEYTFRSTAGKAKLAWCRAPSFVFIRVPEGVTMKNLARMREEALRLRKFYLGEDPPSPLLIALKKPFRDLRETLAAHGKKTISDGSWEELYAGASAWLTRVNEGKKIEFLL